MLNDRKLTVAGLLSIPALGAAVLLSTTAKTAQATCANTQCYTPDLCRYGVASVCTLSSSSCSVKWCC